MQIEKHLRENWGIYFPEKKFPEKFSFIFVKSYKKNSIFVFDGKTHFPFCIFKVANESTGGLLERDFLALKSLDDLNLTAIKDAYPKPLFFGKIDGHDVIIQSFIAGRRMTKFIKGTKNIFWRRSFLSNISLVNNWLSEFHKSTKQNERVLKKDEIHKFFNQLKDKLNKTIGIPQNLKNLEGKPVFDVFQHGDLHPDNVLVEKNKRIAVIDWDLAKAHGLALADLLDFLIRYCRLIVAGWGRGGELRDHLDTAFFKKNNISKMFAQAIDDYLKNLNIEPEVAKYLFLLWLDMRFNDPRLVKYALSNKSIFDDFMLLNIFCKR